MRRSLSILFWFLFFFLLAALVGGFIAFDTWRRAPIVALLETEKLIGPRDALVVNFSQAVREASFQDKITLTPSIETKIEWHDFGKKLVITPSDNWAMEGDYQLILGQGKTSFFTATPIFSYLIKSPVLPKVTSLSPANGATDVILGVEDPIRVSFDTSVRDFYIDFQFNPPAEVVYQNNSDKTEFEILPKGDLEANKKYELTIRAKWRGDADDTYETLATASFTTLPPAPTTWNKNFAERTEEAKRYTRAKQRVGKYIDINLASQIMTLFENGQALDSYLISSGLRGMDTPKGSFAIHNKAPRPWSKQYELYMPYWQAITSDGKYGIHELPEWPGGYKEGANHLGTPVSHGCVRLGIGSAKRVYEWTEVGTPVIVY